MRDLDHPVLTGAKNTNKGERYAGLGGLEGRGEGVEAQGKMERVGQCSQEGAGWPRPN
jgi:hypothetical protein